MFVGPIPFKVKTLLAFPIWSLFSEVRQSLGFEDESSDTSDTVPFEASSDASLAADFFLFPLFFMRLWRLSSLSSYNGNKSYGAPSCVPNNLLDRVPGCIHCRWPRVRYCPRRVTRLYRLPDQSEAVIVTTRRIITVVNGESKNVLDIFDKVFSTLSYVQIASEVD